MKKRTTRMTTETEYGYKNCRVYLVTIWRGSEAIGRRRFWNEKARAKFVQAKARGTDVLDQRLNQIRKGGR